MCRSCALHINCPAGAKLFLPWLVSSDLRRSCTLRRNWPAGAKFSGRCFGVISFLLQLRSTQKLNTTQRLSFRHLGIYSFWIQIELYLGVKIPRDSFLGIPLRFRWCLRTISFWRQLGYSLGFSCRHLGTNSVWRPLGLPLGFAIPGDSLSGVPPCFPPLGFTLIVCLQGTTFSPVGVSYSSPFLGDSISTTSLPCPGALIPQSILILQACDNINNRYNYVSHLQCSTNPSVLSHSVLDT